MLDELNQAAAARPEADRPDEALTGQCLPRLSRRGFIGAAAAMSLSGPAMLMQPLAETAQGCSWINWLRGDPWVVLQRVGEDFLNSHSTASPALCEMQELARLHHRRIEEVLQARRPALPEDGDEPELYSGCKSYAERLRRKIGRTQAGVSCPLHYEPFMYDLVESLSADDRQHLLQRISHSVEYALRGMSARLDVPDGERDYFMFTEALPRAAACFEHWIIGVSEAAARRCVERLRACYLMPTDAYLSTINDLYRRFAAGEDAAATAAHFDKLSAVQAERYGEYYQEIQAVLERLAVIEKRLWAGEGHRLLTPGARRFYDRHSPHAATYAMQLQILARIAAEP